MQELRLIKAKTPQRHRQSDVGGCDTMGTPKFQEGPIDGSEVVPSRRVESPEVIEKVKNLINQIRKTRND